MSGGDPRYSAVVTALCADPQGAGRPSGAGWCEGEAQDPLSGTHVRIFVKSVDRRVGEARFEVRGCPHTMAALVWLMPVLQGQPVDSLAVDFAELTEALGVPAEKRGRLLLIDDALKRAKFTVLSSLS
jgi:NifU-like protein involved in Fe-S cluster formation